MRLRLIRSATLRLEYAGHRLLVDPCVNAKHTRPSYAGVSLNPLVDLPCSPQEVFAGAEATIVSHLHSDHFDPAAQMALPKTMLVFCQPWDLQELRDKGFGTATPIEISVEWEGISIRRTACSHGSGAVLEEMGRASGFILHASGEPSLYWVGDSILYDEVESLIADEEPDIVVVHASGAKWRAGTLIVMDAEQVVRICMAAPRSLVVATHLEAYDHGTVTRVSLRAAADRAGIPASRLLIPKDGQELSFSGVPQHSSNPQQP